MNNLDKQYQELVKTILDYGISKGDRTGTGTKSIFGYTIRHNMKEGFPLLTTKKMAIKALMTELKWFLKGDTNIKYLVENNCNIWNGDAYRHYQFMNALATDIDFIPMDEFVDKIKTDDEFCEMYGELGPVYGKQWRKWDKYDHQLIDKESFPNVKSSVDQIANLIEQLKTNPDSRRLMVNAWNVGELDQMVLPPCHYGFQVYTRELSVEERLKYYFSKILKNKDLEDKARNHTDEQKLQYLTIANVPKRAISLMFNMRSNDVPLGLPFNIASYGLLLEIIGKMVNMVPDELIASLGDAHIYKNQIVGVKEQLTREPYKLPNLIFSHKVNFNGTIDEFLESWNEDSFKVYGYKSHPPIKIPLSN
jgi:thymidylate synthase